MVTLEAPLVDEVLVLLDVAATTSPEEAAVTLCPSTVFASPPAVSVAVYTLNTPDETSLAVKVSDSNVTVCSGTERSPTVTSATFPSIAKPFVAALMVWPLLVGLKLFELLGQNIIAKGSRAHFLLLRMSGTTGH